MRTPMMAITTSSSTSVKPNDVRELRRRISTAGAIEEEQIGKKILHLLPRLVKAKKSPIFLASHRSRVVKMIAGKVLLKNSKGAAVVNPSTSAFG
jgi:hypothetical protein